MKPIDGILFDKDGTLIDFNRTWLPIYQKAARFLADRAGKPAAAETMLSSGGWIAGDNAWVPDSVLASGTNDQIYEHWLHVLERVDLMSDTRTREQYNQLFRLKHEGYAPVVDDLGVFFRKLGAAGIKVGVATMDTEESARQTLEALDCLEHLDFVCGADSGFGLKPEAGMVLAFCKTCEIMPERTIMVGDSPRDLVMGRNAGCALSIGVLTGATTADDLAPFADRIHDDIGSVPDLLE